METYEIQINDRDLDNYPQKLKFKELTTEIVERAIHIVYNNHFSDYPMSRRGRSRQALYPQN